MGRYINSIIVSGEHVVFETKLHWRIYFTLRAFFTLFISPIIKQATCEFVITNKRVILKVGLIKRRTFEMNLQKIESVKVEQSVVGRILGYGTVTIVGTGGTRESFADIKKPILFRRKFQEISLGSEIYRDGFIPSCS
ncbi:MAG TPA: PH domain-containing protein [Syntrophorhabdaceae bacterium]|nr:PH domain-containing protein [Syntrophorhabdaceae bacterium]